MAPVEPHIRCLLPRVDIFHLLSDNSHIGTIVVTTTTTTIIIIIHSSTATATGWCPQLVILLHVVAFVRGGGLSVRTKKTNSVPEKWYLGVFPSLAPWIYKPLLRHLIFIFDYCHYQNIYSQSQNHCVQNCLIFGDKYVPQSAQILMMGLPSDCLVQTSEMKPNFENCQRQPKTFFNL